MNSNKYDLRMGNCLELMKSLPNASVDLVLCDLPYGEVSQKSSGLRLLDRGKADRCDMDLDAVAAEFDRLAKGSIYAFCGTEQISQLVRAFRQRGLTVRVGAWEKTNPSPMNGTRLWVSGMEFCVFARKPNATFNEHCKKALWQAPSGRSKIHPTQKPVQLMERLILASSNPGDVVLDNVMGSGTTGVACMNTGRRFIGMEMDPAYFAIAQQRIQAAMPQPANDNTTCNHAAVA
ncbi:site-specific DNA-methyltransferase [Aquabacterium sp.]|uniref:DNA-methyltransferase n=1 Tax=Aquabacterium sp. TaxID=1872578 RepID=UPI0025BADE01|nr:site-specific DNA-methyltransferase [Aquabacterium sp.]